MDAGFFQYNAVDSGTAARARSRHGKSMREHHCQNMARNAATSKKITPTVSKTQNRRPLKVNFYQ